MYEVNLQQRKVWKMVAMMKQKS